MLHLNLLRSSCRQSLTIRATSAGLSHVHALQEVHLSFLWTTNHWPPWLTLGLSRGCSLRRMHSVVGAAVGCGEGCVVPGTAFQNLKTAKLQRCLHLEHSSEAPRAGTSSSLFYNFPVVAGRALPRFELEVPRSSVRGVCGACLLEAHLLQLQLTALQELHAVNLDCESVSLLEACPAQLTNLTCLTAEVQLLDAAVVSCTARFAGRIQRRARLELTLKLCGNCFDDRGNPAIAPGLWGDGWLRGLLGSAWMGTVCDAVHPGGPGSQIK